MGRWDAADAGFERHGVTGDVETDLEYVTSGLFPGIASVYRGHEGWKAFAREFSGPWESVRIAIEGIRVVDEKVVALLRFDARGRDGLEVHRRFANVWSFRDGLAVRLQAYSSCGQALEAVGLSE